MSKYKPLWNYIKENKKNSYELTYSEIKHILGFEIEYAKKLDKEIMYYIEQK